MRTRLLPGDATQHGAVVECDLQTTAILVVTVTNVTTGARVANATVRVTGVAIEGEAPVVTDGSGVFSILVEQLAQQETVTADPGFLVASDDRTESWQLVFEPVAANASARTIAAYFGTIYELELQYVRFAAPVAANRHASTYLVTEEGDRVYEDAAVPLEVDLRLVIRDGYALADIDDDGLINPASAVSKPANYIAEGWMPHVSPAVPLSTIVRKRRAGASVTILPDELSILWEVIDPPATFARENATRAPALPVAFLSDVYAALQGNAPPLGHGNKNCPKAFGGARENGGGVLAASVLFESDGNSWTSVPADQVSKGKTAVVPDSAEAGAGASPLFFAPPPIGGDSYRLIMKLLDGNGAELPFLVKGGQDAVREAGSGVITIWREVPVTLIAILECEDTTAWDEVEALYGAAYISFRHGDPEQLLQSRFETTLGKVLQGAERGNWPPDCLLPSYHDMKAALAALDEIIFDAFTRVTASLRVADPNAPVKPPGGAGLYFFVCQNLYEDSNQLGQYLGKNQLLSVMLRDFTSTLIHEVGHALYLRHGLTMFQRREKPAAGWAGASDTEFAAVRNDNLLDHDPADVVSCIMSYENEHAARQGSTPVDSHFCGGCLLKLRFWDTVALTADPAIRTLLRTRYAAQATDIVIVRDPAEPACRNPKCPSCRDCRAVAAATVELGKELRLRALVRPDATPNNWNVESWIDLSCELAGSVWASSDVTVASLQTGFDAANIPGAYVAGLTLNGTADITFTFHGLAASPVQVTVVPAVPAFDSLHPRPLRVGDDAGGGQGPQNEQDADTFLLGLDGTVYEVKINGRELAMIAQGGNRDAVTPHAEVVLEIPNETWRYKVSDDRTRFAQLLDESKYGDENIDVDFMRFRKPDGTIGTVRFR